MQLELLGFTVRDVRFGARTDLAGGVLTVDKDALASHLLEDPDLAEVRLAIARPGDSTRIIHILDAVEPRLKVKGGGDFPGFLSTPTPVGAGVTHRLEGVTVLVTGTLSGAADSQGLKESIVDMSGPAARYNPVSGNVNLVIEVAARPGASPVESAAASRKAALKAAVYLASPTRGLTPDRRESLALPPVDGALPRIGYVMPAMSEGELHTTFFYGRSVQSLPALVHPNEILDGALVSADYWIACHRSPTYLYQNEPVIRSLIARHGRDLEFAGVLLCRCLITSQDEKMRQASQTAKVARMLGIRGAVVTMSNGGHAYLDQMLICRELEQAGVATVLGVDEYSDADGSDFPLVTTVPEATAVVSMGNQEQIVDCPAVDTVLGGTAFLAGNSYEKAFGQAPGSALSVALRQIYCSTNQLGWSTLRGRAY
ncbi:MAG TPA: glycine/sarcosine/betaine reductase component B subunit [Thermodesulfobacteriota bacterium]